MKLNFQPWSFGSRYRLLPASIYWLFAGELVLNVINAAYTLIFNIFLKKLAYSDAQIAEFTSVRYLGVLLVAFPLGIFLRGKRMKPFLMISAFGLPVVSVLQLAAVQAHFHSLIFVSMALWGILLMILGVCALPFILRHSPPESQSEAISMNYSNFSLAAILVGFSVPLLMQKITVSSDFLPEYWILNGFALLGFLAVPCFRNIQEDEPPPVNSLSWFRWNDFAEAYDWKQIFIALLPTTVIAIGAGLTIPFIDLFFFNVFGMDTKEFSSLGAIASLLVFGGALIIPGIKRRFGYRVAITLSQSLAVFFLVLLGASELMQPWQGAVWIAMIAYLLRQPLMNIAGPMTNELILIYVGPKNHELISALNSSIWSGSWFLSAILFKEFRTAGLPYFQVLFLTAAFYTVGVIGYVFLIRRVKKIKEKEV